MSCLQPCFEFVKKGLDKAFVLCCNSNQLEVPEEGLFNFMETRRMKAISTYPFLNPAVYSDNNNPKNKQRKKEGIYV